MQIILGCKIDEFLQEKNKTNAWLARKMGVTPTAILFWRRGKGMKIQNVRKLSEVMECTFEEVMAASRTGIMLKGHQLRLQTPELQKMMSDPKTARLVLSENQYYELRCKMISLNYMADLVMEQIKELKEVFAEC